jgi:hypothetical protein
MNEPLRKTLLVFLSSLNEALSVVLVTQRRVIMNRGGYAGGGGGEVR